ncbi:Transmembrane nucleoporin [Naganishia albida]|nr:Transmembrane nucleoporin [Naganishia albida]
MGMDPHYLWATGHFLLLSSTARILWAYTIGLFSKAPLTTFWYKAAYAGTLISYAIVVVKSLGQPALNQTYLQRALKDENVQYALLALYWFISKPVYISLIPFATFSLFHCLTFIRSTIIPKIAKQPATQQRTGAAPAAQPSPASGLNDFAKRLGAWTKANYDPAMRFVSQAELGILVWVIIRAVTFRGSFLTAIFLAHFIRMRYISSGYTRQAVSSATQYVDRALVGKPPALVNAWATGKTVVGNWMGMTMPAQGQPGPAAGAAAAAGGAAPAAGRR